MKLTRFTQSCIVLEKRGKRIVIDPGEPFMQQHELRDLGEVTGVFFTHEHFDHFSETAAIELHKLGACVFGSKSIAKKLGGICEQAKNKQLLEVAGFRVMPHDIDHSDMVDDSKGPENIGYIIDDILLHPGDGKNLKHVHVPIIALPLAGPDISPRDAFAFARQVKARTAIPIHYDLWGAQPAFYQQIAERFMQPFEMLIVKEGETVKL